MEWLSLGLGILGGWGVANIYNFFQILSIVKAKEAEIDRLKQELEAKP